MSLCYRGGMKLFQDHYRQRVLLLLKGGNFFILDKALDLINLGGAALIFGQLIDLQHFNTYTFLLGLFSVCLIYAFAWYNVRILN